MRIFNCIIYLFLRAAPDCWIIKVGFSVELIELGIKRKEHMIFLENNRMQKIIKVTLKNPHYDTTIKCSLETIKAEINGH